MEDHFKIRLEKLRKIEELGVEIYPHSFNRTHSISQIIGECSEKSAEELEQNEINVSVAGRILAIRKMGKSAFLHIFDGDKKMQIYIKKDMVSETDFAVYKLLDIGDIAGVEGKMFKTHSGELTIVVSKLTFQAKSFHPLPEKWHGLQDKELRYRQRYLDLIVNDKTRSIFKLRSQIIQLIRMFFYDNDYLEVETPMTQPVAGGASAKPFITHHNALDIDLYLRIAPELYLKRLLVGGMEKVFELNRNFRNEGIDMNHNPEFTMIEWYQVYNDFNANMELTEQLFEKLNEKFLNEDKKIVWQDREISMQTPFRRAKFMDLISEKAKVDKEILWDEDKLRNHIKTNYKNEECPPTFGKMLDFLFDKHVEDSLYEPIFVTHHPKLLSPLSKPCKEDPRETERFELFIGGMELANGYSELNDPIDQKERFLEQVKDKEKGDDEAQAIDNDFVTALEHGMPPATGEGVGIDRLVMIYSGAPNIKEVILFPALRPKE